MTLYRKIAAVQAVFILIPLFYGCGKDETRFEFERRYLALSRKAVDLYSQLHPLRSSRLGLYESDSLLFTFSQGEIDASTKRLERLLDDLSSLPAASLGQDDIDNSILIIHWIKGELFGLKDLKIYRRNPLLYCWMIEEALFGVPSRFQPPYQGELASYEVRLSRIPALLGNGAELLEDPAGPYVRIALDRLAVLLGEFGTLNELIQKRYSRESPVLESTRRSIEEFRDFIARDLKSRPRGTLIMGLENLSKIMLYDELLDLETNRFIKEAERYIGRFKSIQASQIGDLDSGRRRAGGDMAPSKDRAAIPAAAGRSIPAGSIMNSVESCDSIVSRLADEIDRQVEAPDSSTGKEVEKPEIIFRKNTRYLHFPPVNPYLTIPTEKDTGIVTAFTPVLSKLPCRSYISTSEDACGLTEVELLYHLIKTYRTVREIRLSICEDGDSMRTFVSGDIFRNAWIYLNWQRIVGYFPGVKQELTLLMRKEKIRALARMVVVFRLHSGTLKTGEAADYLLENIEGMTREEAEINVVLASVSPSVAYPGIALILLEDMVKKLTTVKGVRAPRHELRQLLITHRSLPFSMISAKIPAEK